MKEVIDVPGFNDVIVYSEYEPKLEKDETGKVITKVGDIVPHKKVAKNVSFYYNKYGEHGNVIGIEMISLSAVSIDRLISKLEEIKYDPPIDSEYYSDDLPF